MADTSTKTESKKTKSAEEEPQRSLPAGHPQAGYVGPDLSLRDGAGIQPEEDQQAYEEQVQEREDQVAAVAENEHRVAIEEEKAAEKAAKEASKEQK